MDDMDVDALAEYLHLTPPQVAKMAVRGKLPGRKVGGQWRFSEPEIHLWLEQRIGASDLDQLDRVQQVLDRAAGPGDDDPKIAELCRVEAVEVPLNARTRGSVIRSMCQLAAKTGLVWDASAMAEAVQAREQLHPTALESGVALLHPRRPQSSILAESLIALGVCPAALPFSGSGQLTDVFFLICSYDDASHLRILAKLSRMIADVEFLRALRGSQTPQEAWQHLEASEDAIDAPSN